MTCSFAYIYEFKGRVHLIYKPDLKEVFLCAKYDDGRCFAKKKLPGDPQTDAGQYQKRCLTIPKKMPDECQTSFQGSFLRSKKHA